MNRGENLIIGLDIGTTKICVIVAERSENGVDIIGIGTHPSRGLRKGVVVDIDATVNSIMRAVEEAELMADCEITSVYAGIAGGHIDGFNSHGVFAVKDREVREGDIRRVIDAAKAVASPMDREVSHVIAQEFIIDEQDGIREPLGMSGVRLEAKIHIVTAAVTSAQNIVKCANRAGLNVMDIVLEPLASAEAALAGDERELGVCLIDIGGGTTDIAVFDEGSIKHTSVLGLGGYHITNDIARGLSTSIEHAARMKSLFGSAIPSPADERETIDVRLVGESEDAGPNPVPRSQLVSIIRPRIEETLELVRNRLEASGFGHAAGRRLVITGGASQLQGLRELAGQMLGKHVRLSRPLTIAGLAEATAGPAFSTCAGLLIYALRQRRDVPPKALGALEGIGGRLGRVGQWLRDNL